MTGRYETIIVGVPTLAEDEHGAIITALEATISEGKGTLIRTEPWGKRKLAYRVQKFDEGYYTLLFYESDAAVVKELERRIRMNDKLLRFLTVKVDWEEKVAKAEVLAAQRKRPTTPRGAMDSGYGDSDADERGGYERGRG